MSVKIARRDSRGFREDSAAERNHTVSEHVACLPPPAPRLVRFRSYPATAETRKALKPVKDRVSFVITARNEEPAVLQATIDGIAATARDCWFEIVCVDDGSEPRVDLQGPALTIVRNAEPCGVSRARRLGAEIATGDVLVCLDAHMTFEPGWLQTMLCELQAGRLLCAPWRDYDRRRVHAWGSDFEWCEARAYERGLRPGFDFSHRAAPPRGASGRVPMVVGACYMMRRTDYVRLGGFCPLFCTYSGDEIDLSARAWMSGGEVRCVTDACVGHLDRRTFPYPVSFADVEFNQLVLIGSLFEDTTAALLAGYFDPVPDDVAGRLCEADVAGWRAEVQARRTMSDAEFFRRIAPQVPLSFGAQVRTRRGHLPSSRVRAVLASEETALQRYQPVVAESPGPIIPADYRVIRAVVATWRGRAIVLPGGSETGQRALGLELARAGATLYSNEFAILDPEGYVHPYRAIESPAGGAARVAVVALLTFSPGRGWHVDEAGSGAAALALVNHAISVCDEPFFKAVNRVVGGAICLQGHRGPTRPVALALRQFAEARTGSEHV